MAEPNYALLAVVVIAQDGTYHTRSAPVWEQIKTRVWSLFRSASDIPPTEPPDDVAGLGAAIYANFVAAGVDAAKGGVAYALEKVGDLVMTYPYWRGVAVTPADYIDRMGF